MSDVIKKLESQLDEIVGNFDSKSDIAKQVEIIKTLTRNEIEHEREKTQTIKNDNDKLVLLLGDFIDSYSKAISNIMTNISVSRKNTLEKIEPSQILYEINSNFQDVLKKMSEVFSSNVKIKGENE